MSRRKLMKSAAVVATGVAVSPVLAQDSKPSPFTEAEVTELVGELKTKFNDAEMKNFTAAVASVVSTSSSRLKYKLEDTSEPSFEFKVTPLTSPMKGGARK